MDVISDGWEDKWIDGEGLPDEVFIKRLDTCLSTLANPGIIDRVSSTDLWDIVRQTVKAYRPREDDAPAPSMQLKFMGLPLNDINVLRKLFLFKRWLARHITPTQEKEYRREFPAAVEKVNEELYHAVQSNTLDGISNATGIWTNILCLGDKGDN